MKNFIITISILAFVTCVGSVQADILHYDDVITTGSHCVGFDCVNGESFGYSTIKLKENNLQIEFNDTSVGSFPTNDWKIQINSTNSGGPSYFTIWDVDAGRRPFTIEAGAPANSLYVEDYGRVGLGTSIPYVELHIVDGDTPTIRLDQDGSSGWTAQRWDMAGNETNFFIRDVTHGSALTFRIQPDAPSNSITIRDTGYVGMGTWSPAAPLHVLQNTGGFQYMMKLENNGAIGFGFLDTNTGQQIDLNNTQNEFRINLTSTSGYELALEADGDLRIGGTLTANMDTTSDTFPDYVFHDSYDLLSLDKLDAFIKENKHLPNIPSAKDIEAQDNKINMTSMQLKLLEKVEELTLYTLQQEQTINELKAKLEVLAASQ